MNTQAAIEAAKIAAETAARNAWITTIVTVIALLITSGISIWSVMRNSRITKELGEKNLESLEQKRYIDAISAERIKWINTMRDKFSECIKLIYTQMNEFNRWKELDFDESDESVRDEFRNRAIELTYVNNQIVLLLNTTEPISGKIRNLQNKISNHLRSKDNIPNFEYEQWSALSADLIYFHQVVLKAEWKRVKKENKKGEEISDEEMNCIYTEVAKKLSNKKYNKYFGQSES
ncbi:hypothetical protein CON03_27580 [Bacillus cereus]|uniref:hypothetical protein n=1 Tax=Bacillus cereus TaxID=1396 RepID=UPI000BEE4D1D|nr:hypothetical protein [Bacillus cereus]PDZ02666.1 hypothetical protein CON03_27580 [Bacillus cereus]PFN11672.1 hypothetical protein COJ72_30750 [Bacillus cereus]PFS85405.1 hypothetical protein COK56_00390 [Bacillus cereus]PGU48381.1 hypothetical protein COD91_01495 [Bacillus cereus]